MVVNVLFNVLGSVAGIVLGLLCHYCTLARNCRVFSLDLKLLVCAYY